MPPPDSYTVGWICATVPELVAATAMLDEEHELLDDSPINDNNSYKLGRIGRHNVVIAILPKYQYGLVNAANVARDMVRSFHNIRIGLMVGIGGGAPSPGHDIRLGDVVVSSPGYDSSGVFQYDYGKTTQDCRFTVTGHLNQPPQFLLTSISMLEAKYESYGNSLTNVIDNVLREKPKLQGKYQRPDAGTDRLYRSSFRHTGSDVESCADACGDEASNLVTRRARTEDNGNPLVHYGLIASANQLMKDAIIRDTLSAERDVLCFEMEAAGLMNHFPCLVVRGICDYSDTHKNVQWQGYAAMTAAAYAKDLLTQIPPNKMEAGERLSEILDRIKETADATRDQVESLRKTQQNKKDQDILDWLTATEFGPQHSDILARRQKGTCRWFLDSNTCKSWLETENQTLFCPGLPGAGKTILASTLIEHLLETFEPDREVGIAYLYYNFRQRDEQRIIQIVASLLKQLARRKEDLPHQLRSLYERHALTKKRPSLDELVEGLFSVAATYRRVFIAVDALDEAEEDCRTSLLDIVFRLQSETGLSFFATSRSIKYIEMKFQGQIWQEIRAQECDISPYLDGRLREHPACLWEQELKEKAKKAIIEAADGRFLLAELHVASLVDQVSTRDLKRMLDALPRGTDAYDLSYEKALERISAHGHNRERLAKNVLCWISQARRPLTVTMLQEALAIEPGVTQLDEEGKPPEGNMVSFCAGLVTINKNRDGPFIQLVHYTTQQYLNRKIATWYPLAEKNIARVCVTRLCLDVGHDDYQSGRFQTGHFRRTSRWGTQSFYKYSACYWAHHCQKAATSIPEIRDFLLSEDNVRAALSVMRRYLWGEPSEIESLLPQEYPGQMTTMHLLACFGIEHAIQELLQSRHKVYKADALDNFHRTPLSYAASLGRAGTVKLLLDSHQVDVNSKDKCCWSPLFLAVRAGHERVVKLLLENTAPETIEVDGRDKDGRTPLSFAAQNGYTSIVTLLVNTDRVDIIAKDKLGLNPISWAMLQGHSGVVKLLLDSSGVEMNPTEREKIEIRTKNHGSRKQKLEAGGGRGEEGKKPRGWPCS